MDNNEFFTESFHCDNFSSPQEIPRIIKMKQGSLVDFSHKPCEHERYQPSENVVEYEAFDFIYPHGIPPARNRRHIGPIPQIRKGDRVCIVLVLPSMNNNNNNEEEEIESSVVTPQRQRTSACWVKVWSVMTLGILTGHIVSKLLDNDNSDHIVEVTATTMANLRPGNLIAFGATKVLGVVHGENWS
jgi:hypothetical protein